MKTVRDIINLTLDQVDWFYRNGAIGQSLYEAYMCLWTGATFRYSHSPSYCPQCNMTH